jgi:ATP-binding cassette subfamily B protein
MSGTIREVVTFGDQELMKQDARIHQALKVACADQFMADLPEGLDTLLGERGAGLSEGQMQRIAIARAIFSERPILLLDEATSALDEATEAKLLDNLRVMTDKTVVIVTHRPAALDITDKIITFEPNKE